MINISKKNVEQHFWGNGATVFAFVSLMFEATINDVEANVCDP